MRIAHWALAAFAVIGQAQTISSKRSIVATGTGTVSATPDLARVAVGVTSQSSTAQQAAMDNATAVSSTVTAIQGVLGQSGSVKTISYSLNPVYNNPGAGQNPAIVGYVATNIVEATIKDLSLIGRVIDSAVAGGANRVQGITFGLQNEDPVRAQALKSAAAQARTYAEAIAAGLNLHTGNVLHATQGVSISRTVLTGVSATATTTPVLPGEINVEATVTIEVEISS